MRKPKGFKPLQYARILHVYAVDGYNSQVRERLLPANPAILDAYTELPRGVYLAMENGIVLPKRRRGEKFRVIYTTVKEQVF